MGIEWTEDLRTGMTDIDAQHQELFARFAALEDACLRQKGIGEIGKYMAFLEEYVHIHFQTEEREMSARRYPGLPGHQREHEQFRKEISALSNEIRATGARMTLVQTTVWASQEWLAGHVKGADRQFAEYLLLAQQ